MDDDARRRKDAACPHEHKAGDADRWGTAELNGRPAATGCLNSPPHASVAHTATRPSSQGPASALRFNYYKTASGIFFGVSALARKWQAKITLDYA